MMNSASTPTSSSHPSYEASISKVLSGAIIPHRCAIEQMEAHEPPSLNAFRSYVADPSHQGTHLTTLNTTVIKAPQTWYGHTLHFIFAESHASVAEQFHQSLVNAFGDTKIPNLIFSLDLQDRAKISHAGVLFQQGLKAVIDTAIPVLNPHLENITLHVTLPLPDETTPAEPAAAVEPNSNITISPPTVVSLLGQLPQLLANAAKASVLDPIVNQAVDDGVNRALKTLPAKVNESFKDGIKLGCQLDPKTLVKIGGVTHELLKEAIDKADVLVGQNLNRVTEAAKGIKIIDTLLQLTNQAAAAIEPSAETDEAARAMTNYASRVGCHEPTISAEAKKTITNDPLTKLFKTIQEKISTITETLNSKDIPTTLDDETITALEAARTTTAQISKLITQSILPSTTQAPQLPIEKLENSLTPLLQQLKVEVAQIQMCALSINNAD